MVCDAMRISLLAPYYTGSHRQWVDGLIRHSSHAITPLTLPGRFWKWRMHGGAVALANQYLGQLPATDLFLATDMLDLTTFQAITRRQTSSALFAVYFHENQLTYPPAPQERRELHYGFINYISALAADRVFFNSAFHRNDFLEELPRLLKHFPDYNELHTIDQIRAKSRVLPLGLALKRFDPYRPAARDPGPLRILWNHRWEYDKRPAAFFKALYALQEQDVPFEIIVLGESFRQKPEEFIEAKKRLAAHIRHFGYVEQPDKYARLLWLADVQVSCAIQDFFGASTCEAMYCGCLPFLPNRLNYPALIPAELHDMCIYQDEQGLVERLRRVCFNTAALDRYSLHEVAARYDWESMIVRYDSALESISGG
jgi:glycosyltransferase involved in cell wall biosynthesis